MGGEPETMEYEDEVPMANEAAVQEEGSAVEQMSVDPGLAQAQAELAQDSDDQASDVSDEPSTQNDPDGQTFETVAEYAVGRTFADLHILDDLRRPLRPSAHPASAQPDPRPAQPEPRGTPLPRRVP